MFEQNCKNRFKNFAERRLCGFGIIKEDLKGRHYRPSKFDLSTNERNMTRKTRSAHQLRIPSAAFQSGFCAICHRSYSSLEDHIRSKRHVKLIGDDANFISLKGLDEHDPTIASFLTLNGIDGIEVTGKGCDFSPSPKRQRRRNDRMPRRRAARATSNPLKESPTSPTTDPVHRLRSRKNINYMTPPLTEEDSLTSTPDVVTTVPARDFRELRSSSRLMRKLSDQIVETDEVWNSGRPKRACHRQQQQEQQWVPVEESLRTEMVQQARLRSGGAGTPFRDLVHRYEFSDGRPTKAADDVVKFRKFRSSELSRLNNDAENFLFPKKDESSEDEEANGLGTRLDHVANHHEDAGATACVKIKMEDDESMHSTFSAESRGKRRRRTHAEAFITDNQKYYKFETPGSRLRYQGSLFSSMPVVKSKINGDCTKADNAEELNLTADNSFKMNVNEYDFSFERVPQSEAWFQTFQRRDKGEEKYVFLNDDNYWDPLILPYQLEYLPPLDPQECITQYNQIRKCLIEPASASSSVGCSTPDPNSNSNSSMEPPFAHDDDSKISTTMTEESSVSSTLEPEAVRQPVVRRKRGRRPRVATLNILSPTSGGGGKNPRKSPRQHASTLAILSSLIQQRKRKSRNSVRAVLPTIVEETSPRPSRGFKQTDKVDYVAIARNIEEEFAVVCGDTVLEEQEQNHIDEAIDFKGRVDVLDVLRACEQRDNARTVRRFFGATGGARPGRKPGRKKKNRTGWPKDNRRRRGGPLAIKEEDESTVDSMSPRHVFDDFDGATAYVNTTTDRVVKVENNNKSRNRIKVERCDYAGDRVELTDRNSKSGEDVDKQVLTAKVNNRRDLQYQPYVRVQKLDKNHIGDESPPSRRGGSPKRTNRRRMPASPRSPRMLRRPRGRWYRER